jgi:hypothetical protein
MTQPQVPALCPICHTWEIMLPYANRHTTPVPALEAYGLVVIGFWLSSRGARDSDLCPVHQNQLHVLDSQKFMREEMIRTEKARLVEEERRAREEAEKPRYPSEHEGTAQQILSRLAQLNPAPPPPRVPEVMQSATQSTPVSLVPLQFAKTAPPDPNTFLCPTGCGKMLRNGEVHGCPGPAVQNE